MTQAEQILAAVALITASNKDAIFSRAEIREQIGVDREVWEASYSPTFQAMRSDQPGGAPKLSVSMQGIFLQVSHGKHKLITYGQELVAGLTKNAA